MVREVLGRSDYALISELIPSGARVLDLGCGDGALLEWLKANKRVEARGVEINRDLVQRAIARGVTVYQGDLECSLHDYPDQAFDYVHPQPDSSGNPPAPRRPQRDAPHRP